MNAVVELCPTLCDLVDSSLPGSSVHGNFQAKVLEWVAISFSCGFHPRMEPAPPALAGGFSTAEPPGKHKNIDFCGRIK